MSKFYHSGVLPSPVTYFEGVQYDNKTTAARSHEARFGYIPSSYTGTGMGVSIYKYNMLLCYYQKCTTNSIKLRFNQLNR